MKRLKKALWGLVFVITAAGACGCMKQDAEEITAENMKRYASHKYGTDFVTVSFQAARDETYTNILTLSDGVYRFNVYQNAGGQASDDYPQVIVNQKISDLLQSPWGSALELSGNFLLSDGNNITLEYAVQTDVSDILKEHELIKAIVVVKTDQAIASLSQALYRIYQETLALSPKYIDFEVIQVAAASAELENMLLNLPAFYDSQWSKHPEIEAHIRITETDILSPSELLEKLS